MQNMKHKLFNDVDIGKRINDDLQSIIAYRLLNMFIIFMFEI